ncbi:MAG: AAA family ATPase, partial [Selenomonadaceae bacterium]|nr:AAA family ATPase [Selenomonadaceae bacterium]
MLCQFTVRNFRCIKDELTLDMQATSVSEHTESLIESQDGERFLPLAVLYGPNGAGKSTVLLAIYGLICKIMRPVYAISYEKNILLKKFDANVLMKPFAFSPSTVSQPTKYEIFFRTKDYEYQYQLAILKEKIVSEALFRKKISGLRYSRVFSRDKGNGIMLKGSLRGYNFDGISHDLPLLSYLGITHKKNAVIKDVMDWFDHHLCYIDYGNPLREARIGIPKNEELKRLMLEMLSEMGIDVTGYRVEEDKKNVGEIANGIRIFTQHKVNHDVYELELSDESSGTIKMFGILPAIAMSIARGQTLIVDELDAKIHPVLL